MSCFWDALIKHIKNEEMFRMKVQAPAAPGSPRKGQLTCAMKCAVRECCFVAR